MLLSPHTLQVLAPVEEHLHQAEQARDKIGTQGGGLPLGGGENWASLGCHLTAVQVEEDMVECCNSEAEPRTVGCLD